MKTAISIPDEIFNEAERYAKNNGITRSQLFSIAVKCYVNANQYNDITEKLNEVYSPNKADLHTDLSVMQGLSIEHEEW